jgi:transposase InsO family protein
MCRSRFSDEQIVSILKEQEVSAHTAALCRRHGISEQTFYTWKKKYVGLDQWAYEHGVELRFIDPGEPVQNALIGTFNGRCRDECLNQHWFINLAQACRIVEAWRLDYNRARSQSSLGYQTPEEFAQQVGGETSDRIHGPAGLKL